MRFQVVALLPLAAAAFFSQAPQHHARSLDQYDGEVLDILARHLASDENSYLQVREASHGGMMGHGGHASHGHHGHHGHHKKHHKHHGKKHHHSHHHRAAHAAAGAASGAASAASEQPAAAKRSIEDVQDLEAMLYIRDLLDAYRGF